MNISAHKSFYRLTLLISMLLFMLLFTACGDDREAQVRENFKMMVDQLNQSTPLQIDAITVLDKLSLGSGAHIIHHYTIDTAKIEADGADPRDVVEAMQQMLLPLICVNVDTKAVIDFGAKFEYTYLDSHGSKFTSFIIDKAACSK